MLEKDLNIIAKEIIESNSKQLIGLTDFLKIKREKLGLSKAENQFLERKEETYPSMKADIKDLLHICINVMTETGNLCLPNLKDVVESNIVSSVPTLAYNDYAEGSIFADNHNKVESYIEFVESAYYSNAIPLFN